MKRNVRMTLQHSFSHLIPYILGSLHCSNILVSSQKLYSGDISYYQTRIKKQKVRSAQLSEELQIIESSIKVLLITRSIV